MIHLYIEMDVDDDNYLYQILFDYTMMIITYIKYYLIIPACLT
jgi:hypothetical protein